MDGFFNLVINDGLSKHNGRNISIVALNKTLCRPIRPIHKQKKLNRHKLNGVASELIYDLRRYPLSYVTSDVVHREW